MTIPNTTTSPTSSGANLPSDDDQHQRMTLEDARVALGFSSRQGVRDLASRGQLTAIASPRGSMTFDRTEVETLAAARARRLDSRQALKRAGMVELRSFKRWLALTGGTVHWHGQRTAYEPDDVDAVRRAYRPDDAINLTETAKMLDETVEQVRRLVHRGDLPALTKPRGSTGWRFDRAAVERYKQERDRAAMRSVVERWPRPDHDGIERSPGGGWVYPAKLHNDRGSPPSTVPDAWRAW